MMLRKIVDPSRVTDGLSSWEFCECGAFCPRLYNGASTLLDYLFRPFMHPEDSWNASSSWLQILAGEGHNVAEYLAKEQALRNDSRDCWLCDCDTGSCKNFRRGGGVENRRRLTIDPHKLEVSWDWWIDPASNTHILRDTFKATPSPYIYKESRYCSPGWQATWPVMPPLGAEVSMRFCCDDKPDYYDAKAGRRRVRREAKRAAKVAREAKILDPWLATYEKIPGAWRAEFDF